MHDTWQGIVTCVPIEVQTHGGGGGVQGVLIKKKSRIKTLLTTDSSVDEKSVYRRNLFHQTSCIILGRNR